MITDLAKNSHKMAQDDFFSESAIQVGSSVNDAAEVKPDPISDSWCTNAELCRQLGEFDLDPCSNGRSHVRAAIRYSLDNGNDGLKDPWQGSVYCNGPYSNPLPWCNRLADYQGSWCALWKLDPTTKWWSELMGCGASFAPFRKRVKFERPDKPPLTANFPSVLVWHNGWSPGPELAAQLWMPLPSMNDPRIALFVKSVVDASREIETFLDVGIRGRLTR